MSFILRWYSRVNYTVEFQPTQYFEKRFSMNFSVHTIVKNIENACVDFDYLQVDHHLSSYVTFYIMPVYHLQNFNLHWQFQIWFKISKYFNVQSFVAPKFCGICLEKHVTGGSNKSPMMISKRNLIFIYF